MPMIPATQHRPGDRVELGPVGYVMPSGTPKTAQALLNRMADLAFSVARVNAEWDELARGMPPAVAKQLETKRRKALCMEEPAPEREEAQAPGVRFYCRDLPDRRPDLADTVADAKAHWRAAEREQACRAALSRQEGGDHYKAMPIQPIEFIHANRIPFTEGAVIKYVCRHARKGGREDLEKARHFIDLLLELEYPDG